MPLLNLKLVEQKCVFEPCLLNFEKYFYQLIVFITCIGKSRVINGTKRIFWIDKVTNFLCLQKPRNFCIVRCYTIRCSVYDKQLQNEKVLGEWAKFISLPSLPSFLASLLLRVLYSVRVERYLYLCITCSFWKLGLTCLCKSFLSISHNPNNYFSIWTPDHHKKFVNSHTLPK